MAVRTAERAVLRYAPQEQCCILSRGGANFIEQILNDKAEALIEGEFFEDLLAP